MAIMDTVFPAVYSTLGTPIMFVTSFYGHRPIRDPLGCPGWCDVTVGFTKGKTLTVLESRAILGQRGEQSANLVVIIIK